MSQYTDKKGFRIDMEEFKNEQEKVLDIIKQIDEQNNGAPGETKVEEIS